MESLTLRHLPSVLKWQIPGLFPEEGKRSFPSSVRCFLLFVGLGSEHEFGTLQPAN